MRRVFSAIIFIALFLFVLPQLYAQNQTVTNGEATATVNFTGSGCTYNWVNSNPTIGLPASGMGNIASFTAVNTGNTPITATITATPVATGFAYVTNFNNGTLTIVNTATNSFVTNINVNTTPEGISVSPDGTKAYITNEGINTVSVFNAANNSLQTTIPVGNTPWGICTSPDGNLVYVANSGANTLSVISTASNMVVNTITVGTAPWDVVTSPDGKQVYVTCGNGTITVVNATTNTVSGNIPLNAGSVPHSICVSPDGSKLYVANSNSQSVSVVSLATNTVVSNISVGSVPYGMCVSPDGSKLYVANNASNNISVVNLANNSVTAIPIGSPQGISLSADGSILYATNSTDNQLWIINTVTNVVESKITTGEFPTSLGNFVSSSGCNGIPITATITVNPTPPPSIVETGTLSSLTTVYGTPSLAESFNVSGISITGGILITPPLGFEVSTDGINFNTTATISGTGSISGQVYIRLAATTPVGNYSGNIVLSSTNATSINIAIPTSTVSPAQLTITADNITKSDGTVNPPLTITYSGFVNRDGPAQLTTQAIVLTTATTQSPVGQYPITVSGAASPDYTITYIPGVLTVIVSAIKIPDTFTPNGDGINDTWEIHDLEYYPKSTVNIFNRWGQKLYSSIGYPIPWDGRYNGAALPTGTYYYIIDLKNGQAVISGWVAIIK
ncbi:gliding motility-associated-like protein [Mucilaginibacter frigoritolerans]|uniref:Gliding motility-associated-like protein n=1 Tax=Mucilaginibacter frigoritolerans TaxID=652788 RepID=A0A562TYF9_9SPHI|nr:gliding motility-associated C-terminal domain-containing protein [Mucilaginibacter frigoritolerans]TWI98641.1 gliding motility-associated-like protein [Mucilaginibacter frigoritolerans]